MKVAKPLDFVFFHVGRDISQPYMLTKSLKKFNPNSKVIQLSDPITPEVPGVDECFRVEGDKQNLMTFRLKAHSEYPLTKPAAFIDTDMLAIRRFNFDVPKDVDVVLCERSFNKEAKFNPNFNNMDLSEYTGKSLFEVYPFLACLTITKNNSLWLQAYKFLREQDAKFHYWYGDQEALKFLSRSEFSNYAVIPEYLGACLPEFYNPPAIPFLMHFKGASRKALMTTMYNMLGLE